MVSTAIAVTITHASPPRLSQQENKTWGTNHQSTTPPRITGLSEASRRPFCTARVTSAVTRCRASSAFPPKFGSAEIYCQRARWLWSESWEAWTQWAPGSSTWRSHSMDGPWDALLSGLSAGLGSTTFSCPRGRCRPGVPHSNTQFWPLIPGASLLLAVPQLWCSTNAVSIPIKGTWAIAAPFCFRSFPGTLSR